MPFALKIDSTKFAARPPAQKAFNSLIPDTPGLTPPFSGLTDANADNAYLEQLMKPETKLMTTVEILSDHELAAGYRSFEYMRDFYHTSSALCPAPTR